MKKILIIGGVAGGATAAARLRRLDESAEILMFERGEFISFANCGLPYYIGGVIENREDLLLQTPTSFGLRFNIDVRVQSEVTAIFRKEKTITIKDTITGKSYTQNYDKLIYAPGAAPIKPPVAGMDLTGVFTLRSMADTDRIKAYIQQHQPKSAIVAGGGYIGLEMAENLAKQKIDVSIVQSHNQVLSPLDPDMACDLHQHLRKKGVSLYLGNRLQKITKEADGLLVETQKEKLKADLVISAIGVRPDCWLAREAGLELNEQGGLIVNEHMLTSDPNIYGLGDVVEVMDFVTGEPAMIPLAGPANKQARIVADHICGIPSKYEGTQGSSILQVFDQTAACTGINEKKAKQAGINYDKVFLWSPGHADYYPGTKPMSMKVIFEKDSGRILGGQVVGFDGVDKRCDLLAGAIRSGMTANDLTRLELCYAPPYSSAKDPVNMAGYMIENVLAGKVKNFHWHDVDSLPRDGSVTLLDVRNPQEAAHGAIEGFVNIPLDSLRDRIVELDQEKPVYVHCHSGKRSYNAARILKQNGFDAYNLSGGYRLYRAVKG